MKPGIKTTELATTGLGGAGISALLLEKWDASMSMGAGLALMGASIGIAIAVVGYGVVRARTKAGGQ